MDDDHDQEDAKLTLREVVTGSVQLALMLGTCWLINVAT